jgi:shikimate dehydrogenase
MFEKPETTAEAPIEIARYAVFGQPIAHSRSPRIHREFARQSHIALRYDAIEAGPDEFPRKLAHFAADGGRGANITLPLKAAAHAACRTHGPHAARSGVANTLTRRDDGSWHGDNTDGLGLVADLAERHRIDLRGRRTLVLGAGGAVQGVLPALLDAGVEAIVIANRTPERADALADRIGEPARVHTVYWDALRDAGAFDFVLNGTSAGHGGAALELPFSILAPRALAYDMNYGKAAIGFTAWARAAGAAFVHDGLGMLVEQAAEAFHLWHGVRPDTGPVHQALRHEADA